MLVVQHKNEELAQLESDPTYTGSWDGGVVKAFRKRMQQIRAVDDERDFYKIGGMRFEKLAGKRSHQYSMRLNDQWRLIVEFSGKGPEKVIAIIGIEDYH